MPLKLNTVLITDEVDPKCVSILESNGVKVTFNTKLAKDKPALLTEVAKHDGLIVRSATKVTADVIEACNLSIIGRAGTGTDNIDKDAATQKGVIVMNTPGGNTISAAELTCAMICGLSRNIGAACVSMKEGRWDRKLFMGEELQGKTLAIIGLGMIGKVVATRMQSFGMTTIGFDPLVSAEDSAKFGVTSYPIEQLWPLADYITVHVPLIPPTKNLINADVFSKCKKGVKVVNCARGGIIDEEALLDALKSGQCGGAGLDVFVQEPPTDKALVSHPNVLATPHLGASTTEAQSRVAEEIAQQFIDARDGKSMFGALNAQAVVQSMDPASQPMVELGRCLGALLKCMLDTPTKVTVRTTGDAAMKANLRFLQAAVSIGLVEAAGANLVNSPTLAKAAGYEVVTDYVCGGDNSVLLLCNDKVLLGGCVQGTSSVLTHMPGCTPNGGLLLSTNSPYLIVTVGSVDSSAVAAACSHLFTALVSQGVMISSMSTASGATETVVLAQLSTSPKDLNSLTSNGMKTCKLCSL